MVVNIKLVMENSDRPITTRHRMPALTGLDFNQGLWFGPGYKLCPGYKFGWLGVAGVGWGESILHAESWFSMSFQPMGFWLDRVWQR